MSKVNSSTLVAPTEWAKHLRKFGKRQQSRAERRAANKLASAIRPAELRPAPERDWV